MLTRQTAVKIQNTLKSADAETRSIFSKISARKTLTASQVRSYSKKIKQIEAIANRASATLVASMNGTKDVIKASRIDAVENLFSLASAVAVRAKLLAKMVADADELAELEDEVEAEDEFDGLDDAVEAEDEFEDLGDEGLDAEDEEELDLDAEDELEDLEADDFEDEELDAEDELEDLEDEPVATAKRRVNANRRAGASQRRSRLSANAGNSIKWNFGN